MNKIELLINLYNKTNGGLDIIIDVCPAAAKVVGTNSNFKIRSDERTPSAHLYPPKDADDCWHVKDFGSSEDGGFYSPIDLWMQHHGYSQGDFSLALHQLAEEYGIIEELTPSVNKPIIEKRKALPDEIGMQPKVECRDSFTTEELRVWGPCVTADNLQQLSWAAVTSVTMEKEGQVIIKKSTLEYPIFVQTCFYNDENGNVQQFQKLYEPKCYNKAYRFFIIGKKPRNYLFGLSALRRKYENNNQEKLSEVVLVSGGSDAVNCLSMGYQPVWMGSETEELRPEDVKKLCNYAWRIINIPDIDNTGIKQGQKLALRYPQLYTVWMTPGDMGNLHDNRRRPRKDLKDFLQLHPHKSDLDRLIKRAQCAFFAEHNQNDKGKISYNINAARMNYFLALNGFFTLKDDTRKEPIYIRVEGSKVSRIVAKSISNFIVDYARKEGWSEGLINKLMHCRDLPNNQSSFLIERDDISFNHSTDHSQQMFFKNCWIEVSADSITKHAYNDLCGSYVWADAIIGHDYRDMRPMFNVEETDEGYHVCIVENQPSKMLTFLANTSRLYWRKKVEQQIELTPEEMAEENLCLLSKIAAIGYLLYGYKSESEAWALICQDAKLAESEEECNGGSGKSLLLKAVSNLLNMFFIDAHVPTIVDNRFLFDGVTENTDLVLVDECHRKLNFDFFFGRITGDLKGEEKGNHPFQIPFSKSPKFAFATNYVLKKHDASTERRIWPLVFSDYYHEKTKNNDYNESRSIRDELGCNLMGTEYSESDWQADISFMLQCLQFYLSLPQGQRRILPPLENIDQREQMAAVGKDFKQWADDFFAEDSGNLDVELKVDDVLQAFNDETNYKWSPKRFTQHLKNYCQIAEHIFCFNPASKTGKKTDGERWIRRDERNKQKAYIFIESRKKYLEEVKKPQAEEQDLPF